MTLGRLNSNKVTVRMKIFHVIVVNQLQTVLHHLWSCRLRKISTSRFFLCNVFYLTNRNRWCKCRRSTQSFIHSFIEIMSRRVNFLTTGASSWTRHFNRRVKCLRKKNIKTYLQFVLPRSIVDCFVLTSVSIKYRPQADVRDDYLGNCFAPWQWSIISSRKTNQLTGSTSFNIKNTFISYTVGCIRVPESWNSFFSIISGAHRLVITGGNAMPMAESQLDQMFDDV